MTHRQPLNWPDSQQNAALLEQLQAYTQPPHEPVPEIPGLSVGAQRFLGSSTGIEQTARWARVFHRSLGLLHEADGKNHELIVGQNMVLQGLVNRLEARARL